MKHFQACVEAPSGSMSTWRFSADSIEEAVELVKSRYGRGDKDDRVLLNYRVSIAEISYASPPYRPFVDTAAEPPRTEESGWELPAPFPSDGF